MTAEMSSLRPGWAEPVGSSPRPHFRRRRALGALVATGLASVAIVWAPSPATAVDAPAPVALSAFPVQPPCAFWDTFGAPRPPGRVHEGIDIGAAEGKEVYAVADGSITKVYLDSPTNRGGNSFRLTAADGTYYFYGHLSAFAPGLALGTKVTAGQLVGYIGHTGNAGSVNHLHFEVHPGGGAAVNAYAALRAVDRCRRPAVVSTPANTLPPTTVAAAAATSAPAAAPAATTPPAAATTPAAGPGSATSTPARLSMTAPVRVVNTAGGSGSRAAAGQRTAYTVTGVNSVPATATLLLVNVTASGPGSNGHLAVLPCAAQGSSAATLNFRAGMSDATQALVSPVNGQICIESSVTTNVAIDVVGYDGQLAAGVTSIRPTRLLEQTTLSPGVPLAVKASGVGGVPPANGVSITVTSENAAAAGNVAVYGCDRKRPKIAQVTVGGGPASTGLVARAGGDGTICLVSNVTVDVTVDATAAWAYGGSNKLRAVTAVRAFDSRGSGSVAPGRVVKLTIANDELTWAASVASVVVTGLDAAETGSITAWPCGQQQPGTETVVVSPGRVASASAFVGLGGGQLCLATSTTMNIIVDVTGGA